MLTIAEHQSFGQLGQEGSQLRVFPPKEEEALPSRATIKKIDGQTRFVVPPANAMITDAIGVGLAGLLFFATDNTLIKVLAAAGGLWMGVAFATKIPQVLSEPEKLSNL